MLLSGWLDNDTLVSAFQADAATQWWFGTNGGSELYVAIVDTPYYGGCGTDWPPRGETVGANLQTGQWYHVAFVYDGSGATNADRLQIYVNGAVYPVTFYKGLPIANALPNAQPVVRLGYEPTFLTCANSTRLNGKLDDIRIYTTARNSTDIYCDYTGCNSTEPSTATPTPTSTSTSTPTVTTSPRPTSTQVPPTPWPTITPTPADSLWISRGPEGGQIVAIAVSPNFISDQTVFVAPVDVGVHKSTDAGTSWRQVSAPFRTNFVVASPAYASDHTIFAGGGWTGIVRSVDDGQTWVQVNAEIYHGLALAFSPNYAADHIVLAGGSGGFYKSTDSGTTWQRVSDGPSIYYFSLLVAPGHPNTPTIYASGSGGIYKSTDDGVTWVTIHPGMERLADPLRLLFSHLNTRPMGRFSSAAIRAYSNPQIVATPGLRSAYSLALTCPRSPRPYPLNNPGKRRSQTAYEPAFRGSATP